MKMSRLLGLVCVLGLVGCGGPLSPEFVGLTELKASSIGVNNISLTGQAEYLNPNSIGGKVVGTDITIYIEDVKITTIKQQESIEVPANDKFKVPVEFQFNPKELIQNNDGFLKGALNNLFKKHLMVKYEGHVIIEIAKIKFNVPVEYSEEMNFGLNFN